MRKPLFLLLAGALALGSCQQTPSTTDQPATPAATPAEPARVVNDAAAARRAVADYLKTQPEARLYVMDSANVVDVDTRFQVLVPRSDWAGRMPNRARFEVDKATGTVQDLPVK